MVALRASTTHHTRVDYLHGDHLGSVSLTTDAQGVKIAETRYKAWGEVRYSWGAAPTDLGFTGQRADATGLMFYQARYYSPVLGRFISPDTIVPDPGNPQDLNRYLYTNNNPVKYIDPSGHSPFLDFIVGAATQYASDMWAPILGAADLIASNSTAGQNVVLITDMTAAVIASQIDLPKPKPVVDETSNAYHAGQAVGRLGSTVVSTVEAAFGLATMALGVTGDVGAIGIEGGSGGAATAAAVPVAAVSTSVVVAGGVMTLHGGAVLVNNLINPVQYAKGSGSNTGSHLDNLGIKMSLSKIKNAKGFGAWVKQLEQRMANHPNMVLSTQQADELVELARQYGVEINVRDLVGGHVGTAWPGPHLHIGNSQFHIRVPNGYIPPTP